MKEVCVMAYYSNPSYYGYYPQLQPMMVQYPQQQIVEQQPIQYSQQTMGTQSHPNESYFIWVQGEAGAKSYPVARGTTVPLFDSEGDYVYFKSVDSNGVPLPLITKVISDPPHKEKIKVIEEETEKKDMNNYITKDVYDELKKKYEALENRILELETKPTSSFSSTFTGNTFNNTRKDGQDNGNKFTI